MDKKTIMRKAIADALEQRLERADSLRDVSVQDILDECGLSRPTFYRYFSDKYDVVNWSYTYYVEELTGLYGQGGASADDDMFRHFVQFFYDKRHYFHKVLDYLGQNSFYDHYFDALVRWYTIMRYQQPRNVETLTPRERYMLIHSAAGTAQVLRRWLSDGCRESPEEMFHILQQLAPGKTHRYDP